MLRESRISKLTASRRSNRPRNNNDVKWIMADRRIRLLRGTAIKREQTAFVLVEFLPDVNQITNQPSLPHPILWNCFVFEDGRQTRQFIRRITRSICRSRTFQNADVPLQFVPLAFVIDDTTVVIQRFRHVSKYSIRS